MSNFKGYVLYGIKISFEAKSQFQNETRFVWTPYKRAKQFIESAGKGPTVQMSLCSGVAIPRHFGEFLQLRLRHERRYFLD